MKILIYDIEVFKEDFIIVIKDYDTKKKCIIVNDVEKLKKVYSVYQDAIWVGYNNRHYDQFIFKSILIGLNPKEVSNKLIDEGIPGYKISKSFNNIQMYNYDCILLNTSLKQLEGFMGESIQETTVPFDIDRKLTESELEEVIKYCVHDVEQTELVFDNTKEEFDSHVGLIQEFNLPLDSYNKTKARLSAEILGAERLHGLRDEFDYVIPECFNLGKYEYIREWYLNEENKCYNKINKKGRSVSNKLKTDIMGVENILGFGGIHGAVKKYVGEGFYVMSDIASMYPATMINFDLLSRAVKDRNKYKQIRDERIVMKKNKDKREYPRKILLNY